jgi:flagellar biosynthesis protein FliR
VTPISMPNLEAQLLLLILASIRPGAALIAAPVFGASQVPLQLRLLLALAIGVPASGISQLTLPEGGMVSLAGAMLVASEALIGLAIGFTIQIAMAGAVVAGETISNTMGLGFAAMTDPGSGHSTSAIGQFLTILATLIFLAADGHLALISVVIDTYRVLPPGGTWLGASSVYALVEFGGLAFSAGLVIALPVATAIVIVQIILGVVSRSAPTLNLFAVSLPASLIAGIVLLAIATPVMADAIGSAIGEALAFSRSLAGG